MDTNKFMLESGATHLSLNIDGRGFSEAIKGSNVKDVKVCGFEAFGGDEDCIDCVRGMGYKFESGKLYSGQSRTFITAKGGIDGFVLKDIELIGNTRWFWDISLGDHTIYYNQGDESVMKNILIDSVRRADGKPVTILCLLSEKPKVTNGKYRIIKPPLFLVKLYFNLIRLIKA